MNFLGKNYGLYDFIAIVFFCSLFADGWSESSRIGLQIELDKNKYETTELLKGDFDKNKKNAGEDNLKNNISEVDLKQVVSSDSVKNEIKSSSVEPIPKVVDDMSRLALDAFGKGNAKVYDNGNILPFTTLGVGNYSSYSYDFSDKFKEELRVGLGEETYAKIVLTYGEIQSIDDWINSTVAQYGFDDSFPFGGQKYSGMGLDEQTSMRVILQGNEIMGDRGLLSESSGKDSWMLKGDNKVVLAGDYNNRGSLDNYAQKQRFSIVLKYFTIVNFVYLFFFVMFVSLIVKGFKFLVRQQ